MTDTVSDPGGHLGPGTDLRETLMSLILAPVKATDPAVEEATVHTDLHRAIETETGLVQTHGLLTEEMDEMDETDDEMTGEKT